MKNIFKHILLIAPAALMLGSCDFLEPYPNGSYNEENYMDYPKIIRGFVDKAYNLRPSSYYATEFIGTDAASDNALYRDENSNMRQFSTGSGVISSNPFASVWSRAYTSIYYCNLFLENNVGLNTHYLVDADSDKALRKALHGDAYALRAWNIYDLLKTFCGIGTDGKMYGVPFSTSPIKSEDIDDSKIVRASFDETVKQILDDCDSALLYIPLSNRDYPGDKPQITPVTGSVRYRNMDQISVYGLKAMTYLLWASPLFCQDNAAATERYRLAAENAAKVLNHKLTKEASLGFDPLAICAWGNANSYDVVYCSHVASSDINDNLYPEKFQGSAGIVPSQNLVDAFPMANGYPITDSRSGYDPTKPYEGRDPRFYANIFYDGSSSRRNNTGDIMYTFNCVSPSGNDAPGVGKTSPSSYYIRKFVSPGYNPFDASVNTGYRFIAFERWEQMCLIFAEAACKCAGPTATIDGLTAKQALSFVRSRSTVDNVPGLGATADPYLDECAANADKFYALVKNEWRICTCFEGYQYYNVRRWTSDPDDLSNVNVEVKGAIITQSGATKSYDLNHTIETKKFNSLWNPLPYMEVRRCSNLVQNKGWENWK